MKSFVAILALAALASADVAHLVQTRSSEADAQTIEQDADVLPDQYQYHYKTNNGISAQESGALKPGPDGPAIAVQGSNQYTAPGGEVIQTEYTADENGYLPKGAHLPTPPPTDAIPEYILRSIEYIRTHPSKLSTEN